MSYVPITKLSVNIAKYQTYITYANKSTRLMISNPSGFVFRCLGSAAADCCTDSNMPASFLSRHFAKGGSLRRTRSMREFLLGLGLLEPEEHELDCAEELEVERKLAEEQQQLQLEQIKLIEWHTWELFQLPVVLPEKATSHEWPKAQMQMFHGGWHLQSCHWSQCNGNADYLPDCHCIQIKESMDHLNDLVNKAMPKVQSRSRFTFRTSAPKLDCGKMNDNILNLTDRLQHLNKLLEKQNQKIFNSEML